MEELTGRIAVTAPKIEFKNITKIFETRSQTIVAVKDFNMQVETGDFVSIIGPSGCGKSTLIRMLDGIIQPTEGELFIEGFDCMEGNQGGFDPFAFQDFGCFHRMLEHDAAGKDHAVASVADD